VCQFGQFRNGKFLFCHYRYVRHGVELCCPWGELERAYPEALHNDIEAQPK